MTKFLLSSILLLSACHSIPEKSQADKAKQEIFQTELDFEKMAQAKGLAEAFSYYADSAATVSRGSYVIHGKDSIRIFYEAPRFSAVKLAWKPDFVEVSRATDLGYTYGKYTFTSTDSTGKSTQSKGIFHTVWKKQIDGQWRFVWD